ncbi:MAG TPA: hypothetical protein VFL69_02485 [Marmoricola sp.]|jgi:hypothetical protein|nr:hypothetical protein [Marmoricola sp.]
MSPKTSSEERGVATIKGSGDEPFPDRKKEHAAQLAAVRARLAMAIRVVFLVFAVVLALGALLVAFRDNVSETNGLVKFIKDFADAIDGPFSRDNGVFHFQGKGADAAASAVTKNALVNWGLAAVIYLVIGRVLGRLVAGRSAAR